MSPSRLRLLHATQTFCNAFAEKHDISEILSLFSKTHQVSVIEHGDTRLASFLGKPFVGLIGVRNYFEDIGSLLSYENIEFSEFTVDSEVSRVTCKGKGNFTWLNTGESWSEVFIYMLDFDDELKVVLYEVWADTGSAYLARLGKLKELEKSDR